MSAILAISDLKFAYASDAGGSVPVFADFALQAEQGESVRLVGPNGCGKSTLLDLIAGRLSPISGTILVGGKPPRFAAMATAYLRQKPIENVAPNLTVAENLAFAMEVRTPPAHWTRRCFRSLSQVDERLRKYDLSIAHLRSDQAVGTLSGGQIQWLGLAMALLTEPRLLLLDEPTASLDTARTVEWFVVVSKYCLMTETTLLYVCHDIPDEVNPAKYLNGRYTEVHLPQVKPRK